MELDLEKFRLNSDSRASSGGTAESRLPKRVRGAFLRGPVSMSWFKEAAKLEGKCVLLGVVLWHLAGMKNSRAVKLSNGILSGYNISRWAKDRGLKALVEAKLISVEQKPGCSPVITLLDVIVEAVEERASNVHPFPIRRA